MELLTVIPSLVFFSSSDIRKVFFLPQNLFMHRVCNTDCEHVWHSFHLKWLLVTSFRSCSIALKFRGVRNTEMHTNEAILFEWLVDKSSEGIRFGCHCFGVAYSANQFLFCRSWIMLQQIKHSTVSNGIQRLQTPSAQTLLLLARLGFYGFNRVFNSC